MESKQLTLSDDMRAIFSTSGLAISGNGLSEVLERLLPVPAHESHEAGYYEVRRDDAPMIFTSLLKLQSCGHVRRHMEVDDRGGREVLRIEESILNAILIILKLILGVVRNLEVSKGKGGGDVPNIGVPVCLPGSEPLALPYIPTWKRERQVDGYGGPTL